MIGEDQNPGLYFTSVDEIFNKIQERKKVVDFEIHVSIVEIYNENIKDLLSKKNIIKIRENQDGIVITD